MIGRKLTAEQVAALVEWAATEGMGWNRRTIGWPGTPWCGEFWVDGTGAPVMLVSDWHPDVAANQALLLADRQNLWWDYALGHSADGFFVFNWSTVSERPYGHPDTTLAVAETAPMAVLLAVAAKSGWEVPV